MVLQASTQNTLDEVDIFLASQDGKIIRPKDPQRCRHTTKQKCTYCLPIDPYDEEYLKEKDIKHMSFHAYIRKLMEGRGKGTQLKKPLESTKLSVDLQCPAHKPYPKGICTKCRPPAVTLNRQKYRHVDNISMENDDLVNDFLNHWRLSSLQRAGFLIGKYEPHSEVPLGVKAVVAAIYEPPQTSTENSVELVDEGEQGEAVTFICDQLGLKRLGWIFTDLWSADSALGTVHCTRHSLSYLLSAEEVITAGSLQLRYPNRTEYCTEGVFGSKFVTVVASGDESEHINFHGYQVSDQCTSLVEASLLCPTNYPELAYIRETPLNPQHYLTGVHFTEKNEYGVEVMRDGRPLPVEFLLVDVPAGMPKEPQFTFHRRRGAQFVIENRQGVGQIQDGHNLSVYCEQFSLNQFLEQASNFHFLLYLATQTVIKFSKEELSELCAAVKEQDRGRAMEWAKTCGKWTQLVAISHNQQRSPTPEREVIDLGDDWACNHCTFENSGAEVECAMCSLPRN